MAPKKDKRKEEEVNMEEAGDEAFGGAIDLPEIDISKEEQAELDQTPELKRLVTGLGDRARRIMELGDSVEVERRRLKNNLTSEEVRMSRAVSYTHLTLPTICSV